MPVIEKFDTPIWRRRTSKAQWAIWGGWLIGIAIVGYCWKLVSDRTVWFFVTDAGRQAADMAARMVPPKWSYMDVLWWPVWDTINIATLGTMLALAMAFPIAFLAARNTTPHPAIRALALFVIVSSRSINSLIWALMLVAVIGPGVFAGVLAIGLRSIGFCAKLLYEAIEETDAVQIEAIEATGASGLQKLSYGVLPQILPAFAGISVFRWDINIRESTVLGLVGAGGIGLQLDASISTLAWTQVSLILLVILATVVISEWVSAKVRHAII
ncbi:MAG: phosphonate ABC transporter, permease protein PhnE [Aestuariivirgaceae bacterium]